MKRLIRILRVAFLACAIVLFTAAGRAQNGPFTNSLGMNFVPVPGTKILMCTTDTTVAQYKEAGFGYQAPEFPQGPTHPAVNVSWDEAHRFCRWLSKKEGRNYRLPKESEWDAAVGPTKYPWGDQWPPPDNCGNYAGQEMCSLGQGEAARFLTKGFIFIPSFSDHDAFTSPVGSYPANGLGLYDMGGNVWQWCDGWFDASHKGRVLRGASWISNFEIRLRSSYRRDDIPSRRKYACYGFRCVLVVSGSQAAVGWAHSADVTYLPSGATVIFGKQCRVSKKS
jgi:formylglycine-generating enzyme required for sulfatase activity